MPSTESEVFREYSAELVTAIAGVTPKILAGTLCAKNLIEEETQDEVSLLIHTKQAQADIIVAAVRRKIKSNSQLFHEFVKVLKDSNLKAFGEKMESAYSEAVTTSATTTHQESVVDMKQEEPIAKPLRRITADGDESEDEENRPAMPQLLQFKKKNGEIISIARKIGTDYEKLGIILLQDNEGARVKALEQEHQKNAERINCEILQEWIRGGGLQPATWRKLIKVLISIGLKTLADDIRDSLSC